MRLSFVRSYVTLVETGSFTDTAQSLGLSQPTVSEHVRKLERFLGVQLIERRGAGSRPTSHGQSVLPYAKALLTTADRMAAIASAAALRIGCSNNIASYFLAEDLNRFQKAEPMEISWEVQVATNPEVADRLETGQIDLAAMEWPDSRPGFEVLPWRTEKLVVILPPDHPLAGHEALSSDQVLSLDMIGGEPGSGTGTTLRQAFGPEADRMRITRHFHSTEAVKDAVRAGLGASIVLEKAVRSDIEAGRLAARPVAGAVLEKHFHLALPAGMPDWSPAVRLARALAGGTDG